MNTPIESNDQETRAPIDEQRRRLSKVGLAAPVVLGTLLSRPVLGATYHNCTISGQMSGNVSTHAQGTCSELGGSLAYWRNSNAWPSYIKGTVTDPISGNVRGDGLDKIDMLNSSEPPGSGAGYRFKDVINNGSQFVDVYRRRLVDATTGKWVRLNPANSNFDSAIPMTLHEVLYLGSNTDDSPYVGLGREAVVALLNALDDTKFPDYPLTPELVIDMFNACFSGGYEVASGVYWNATQVRDYFYSLHP